jgi:hypothetical protein
MYVEAVKWAMGLVNADVTPRPLPAQSGNAQNDGMKNGQSAGVAAKR